MRGNATLRDNIHLELRLSGYSGGLKATVMTEVLPENGSSGVIKDSKTQLYVPAPPPLHKVSSLQYGWM